MLKMHKRLSTGSNEKGFTLIELAIVLVIIGMIVGAIMKGKDVMRSAQTKQFYQSFLGKWVTMADNYYDKTGVNLADGTSNGGTSATTTPDGFMDGTNVNTNKALIRDALIKAGINPCDVIKSGNLNDLTICPSTGVDIAQGAVDSEIYGKVSNIIIQLYALQLPKMGTALTGTQLKNIVVAVNVPLDIAQAMDTLVDGISKGEAGRFINLQACAQVDDATSLSTGGGTALTAFNPYTPTAWPTDAGKNNYKCDVGYILEH